MRQCLSPYPVGRPAPDPASDREVAQSGARECPAPRSRRRRCLETTRSSPVREGTATASPPPSAKPPLAFPLQDNHGLHCDASSCASICLRRWREDGSPDQRSGDRVQFAAWPRRCRFNLFKTLWTWDFVVATPMLRRLAISLLLSPVPIRP